MNWFQNLNPFFQSLIAGSFTWGITALGSAIVCFFKEVNKTILNFMLGLSSGIMISASFWSLLLPALNLAKQAKYTPWLLPSIGFLIGGFFVLYTDKFLHKILERKISINKRFSSFKSFKKSLLLILAITLHNIPEGMVIGVAFASVSLGIQDVTLTSAMLLSLAIGIQNFPEGAAVSLPLRREGLGRFDSFMFGQSSAIVEPISAVIGVFLVSLMQSVLPFLLAFAAGAMIIVVARELLPESIQEDKNLSTIGVIFGFTLMMVLDVLF